MSPEEQAERIGESKSLLLKRLVEARSCLVKEYKALFMKGRLDFANKRLVSPCGNYALQWKLRNDPDEPESYENQQTSTGVVNFIQLRKKKEVKEITTADEAEMWWEAQGKKVPPRDEWSDHIDINSHWQKMYRAWLARGQ